MPEIFRMPQSSFVRTVRISCEEKGVAYRLTPAMPHSPAVLAIHPLGKIPAMRCAAVRRITAQSLSSESFGFTRRPRN
jgi:glutathione S-transferase